ncbi:uncharacterized protein YoxC [Flavobacteriaceae bacterium MAR_2009_75]|nr:uncharacterized protein YoxC [Flavobacteriaceae bacterium MAR_2009_75]
MKYIDAFFKLIEPALPVLALAFTILGVIIGGYLTTSFRSKSIIKLDKIQEIDNEIKSTLSNLKSLNDEISQTQKRVEKIGSKTQKLVDENLQSTGTLTDKTNNLIDAQNDLNKLAEKNIELVNKASNNLSEMMNKAIGGDTYLKFEIAFTAGTAQLEFVTRNIELDRKYRMKNVRIRVTGRPVPNTKRERFNVYKRFEKKVFENNSNVLRIEFDNIEYSSGQGLVLLDLSNYDNEMHFSITVNSDNFSTRQHLSALNIKTNPIFYSVIYKNDGGNTILLSEEKHRDIIIENGKPVYKKNGGSNPNSNQNSIFF